MSPLHTKTRPAHERPRLAVVPAEPVPAAPDDARPCCAAAAQIEGALLHLQIALRTYSAGLPVDWSHVAVRMGQTLLHAGGEAVAPEDEA